MRIFVIVAKNRPDLYQYFMSGLAGVDGVEVILDRRIGPEHPHPSGPEAALDSRRVPRTVYEELEQRGFVIVRLPG